MKTKIREKLYLLKIFKESLIRSGISGAHGYVVKIKNFMYLIQSAVINKGIF